MLKLLGVAAVGSLGLIAAAASLSQALGRVAPAAAAVLYPHSATMLNRQAMLQVASAPEISDENRRAAEALARHSLTSTLLNPAALRLMAVATSPTIEDKQARPWMLAAQKISHRDSTAHIWLAQDAARRGDSKRVLDHVDYALRSSQSSSEALMPVLLSGLVDPVVRNRIPQLVRAKVFWTGRFLEIAASESKRPDLVAQVVLASGGFPERSETNERILLTRLLAGGLYRDALAFARFMDKNADRAANDVALNDQTVDDRIAPLSWQINPDTTSLIRREDGGTALASRIERDRVNQIANKLVYSAAGPVRISGSVQFAKRSPSDALKIEAGCPSESGTPFQPVGQSIAAITTSRQTWSVNLSSDCDPVAIRFVSMSDLDSTGNDVTIWGLSLSR